MNSNSNDMSSIVNRINELIKRTDQITGGQKCAVDVQPGKYNMYPCDKTVATTSNTVGGETGSVRGGDAGIFGGDPRNSYRELRRYLMEIGIDTRIFSFGTIPIPDMIVANRKNFPTLANDIGSLDNCFFFEMRKSIQIRSYSVELEDECVNAMVIMFRVFFENSQDSPNFCVQAVLNHHHDAILSLNNLYGKVIIPGLKAAGWSQPTAGREGTRVTYFEKRFTEVNDFKRDFNGFYHTYRPQGLRGNNIQPHV